MYEYYVEKSENETGEHLVHSETCSSLPTKDKLRLLGVRSNISAPVKEAKDWYTKVSTCPECISS